MLAELVNGPFDRVALLVGFAVEPGRATAFAILAEPGLDLIGRHCESAAKWILAVSPARDRPSASRSHGLPVVAPPAARFLSFDSAPPASRDAQHGHGQPLRVDVLGRLVPGPGRVLVSADHCRANCRAPSYCAPVPAGGADAGRGSLLASAASDATFGSARAAP